MRTLPDGTRDTWTGKAERTGRGAARLLIDNVRYRLKPAPTANATVGDLLDKISQGEVTENCRVTGVIELSDYAWLTVERIEIVK